MKEKLKEKLKEISVNNRQVTIRYSMGICSDKYTMTIRDKNLSKEKISKIISIAKDCEEYSRDYVTGEILEGGNTFINVLFDLK